MNKRLNLRIALILLIFTLLVIVPAYAQDATPESTAVPEATATVEVTADVTAESRWLSSCRRRKRPQSYC